MSPAARANSATVEVAADHIRSRDGFDVRVSVRLPVKLHESPVDRAAFARKVGEGRVVAESVERIAKQIDQPIRKAVEAAAEGDAEELVASPAPLAEAAREAARLPLFAAGLEIDGDVTALVDAPALRQRKAEQAAADAERAAQGRAEELLLRFEDIRRESPDIPPGRLLMAVAKEERAETLRLLFEAAARKDSSRLMLAAGTRLFEVDSGRHLKDVADLGELGPIRCLRKIEHEAYDLAAGARDGVILFSTRHAAFSDRFARSKSLRSGAFGSTPLGFSDVAHGGSRKGEGSTWATHRDLGLFLWPDANDSGHSGGHDPAELRSWLEQAFSDLAPQAACSVVTPPGPARATAVAAVVDSTYCGSAIVALAFDGTTGRPGSGGSALLLARRDDIEAHEFIIDLEPRAAFDDAAVVDLATSEGDGVIGVLQDGRTFRLSPAGGPESLTLGTSFGRFVTAACGVPWLGDVRVAACVEDGPVLVGGPDDDVQVEYKSDYKGFSAVAASAGRLAAVSGDRQRVIVWDLHAPERPIRDLYVMSDTRSRVADAAFA